MKPKVITQYLNLFVSNSTQKILEVLFRYPEREFSLSDLAKEAKVAKPNMGINLFQLQRLEFITILKLTKIWRIKANTQSKNFLRSKIVYNLNFLYQSGLIDVLVDHFANPKAIVLFGSFRRGEDFSTSDIDIAIEIDEANEYETTRLNVLLPFEKAAGRKIQLHLFNRKNVDLHVFNNIANGVVIYGFLEVKP